MQNKVKYTYSIVVNSFISNNEEADKIFPEKSSLSAYTPLSAQLDSENNFWAIRKNKKEILSSLYRSGICEESSLKSKIENGKFYVHPGEFVTQGELFYLNKLNSVEGAPVTEEYLSPYACIRVGGQFVDEGTKLPFVSEKGILNYLSTYIYNRAVKNSKLFVSPKEIDSDSQIYRLGYRFDSGDSTLYAHSQLTSGSSVERITSLRTSNTDIVALEPNFHYGAEFLGRSLGLKNEVYKTKYYPISRSGTDIEGGGIPNLTTVFSRNRTTGAVTAYYGLSSYMEAEKANLANAQSENGQVYIYLDRLNGKFFFRRQTLKQAIVAEVEIVVGLNYMDVDGSLFEDNGLVTVVPPLFTPESGYNTYTVLCEFYKISTNRIVLVRPEGEDNNPFYLGATINPYSAVPQLSAADDVYCYYGVCIGFTQTLEDTGAKLLETEMPVWAWRNQKTIAALSMDKVFPYKITLKAVDVPYLRRGETTGSYVYGPIGASQELVLLEGLVLSEDDLPLGNQEVTITIESGYGLVNGQNESTVITDDEGKFYGIYDPNLSVVSWVTFDEEQYHASGGITYLTVDTKKYTQSIANDIQQKNIIYAITKDDGTVGTIGQKYRITLQNKVGNIADKLGLIIDPSEYSTRAASLGYEKGILFYDLLRSEDTNAYIGGKLYITFNGDGVAPFDEYETSYTIKAIIPFPEGWKNTLGEVDFEEDYRKRSTTFCIVTKEDLPDPTVNPSAFQIKSFRIIKKNDIEFNPAKLNGRKSVLVEDKDNLVWKHPEHPELSVVKGPIMTTGYSPGAKKFHITGTLPIPSSSDPDYPIAGYAMIPERAAKIVAYTISDGEIIYSNKIEFEIEVNQRDKGVIENLLKTVKVPYGWRFKDSYSEDASTVGINTFFTINRVPSSSQQDPKIPLISYVSSNGINYLGYSSSDSAYSNASSSIKMKINLISNSYSPFGEG